MNPYINAIQRALAVGDVAAARTLHDHYTAAATTRADAWWVHHLGNAIQRALFSVHLKEVSNGK